MIVRMMFAAVMTAAATAGGATSSAATAGTTPTHFSPATCSVAADDCFKFIRRRYPKKLVCQYCEDDEGHRVLKLCWKPEDALTHPKKDPGPIKR
ncbi:MULTISPECIES: hypothetical protein [unclassified Nonomuraea]|uniref:hypothetical protein n=1 Tax=unclassified Nonomuraea TaxID=2593643 RepID=UPI0033F75947